MEQLTKEQAIAIYEGKEWQNWTDEQIVQLQLYQDFLCVPFGRFHAAVEKVLGRPVWTHEFAGDTGRQRLIDEYEGKRPRGTVEESFEFLRELVPDEKIIIVKPKAQEA